MPDIVRTEGVLGGEPRLAGHRISVLQVAEMVLEGDREPEYVADQLDISLAAVHSALAYYYDNQTEMANIRDRTEELDTEIAERALSPDQIEP